MSEVGRSHRADFVVVTQYFRPERGAAQVRLGAIVDELRSDTGRRAALSARASELGAVHRSGALAQLVESVALA